MTAEHDGRAGLDALMAAIVDEPLPQESRADDAFMAEHRSATADLALLREQLGVLADALTAEPAVQAEPAEQRAAPAHRPGRLRRSRPPRASRFSSPSRPSPGARLRPLVLRAAGVAAAGAMVFGAGWAVVQVGHGASDDADAKASAASDAGARADGPGAKGTEDAGSPLGDPGYLVCTRLVVEGEVTDVRPLSGTTRERVTLRVTHAYRPAESTREAGFEMERDMDPLLAAGDHVLVALGRGSVTPDVWAVGEADIAPMRTALARALPETADLTCTGSPSG
ncbi:hypothetical protein PYK79_20005 [Streptomyces sp. ID05-04B]|uniref:hypothetical protein n=1 Tax=unclassified Streptomyces TaxID=2593676 RepID=UPI000D1B8946|nr:MULTISPECIES: hypothetical protein [unclassified Streptomyces]AVV42582.1 hypothetical protein C6376_15280 [Streptomyces sp. P3]MDX5565168.1 hypothetical protein [Streptomyces sp. ID05-04B]